MITCPKCGELNGNDRTRCFKCSAPLDGSSGRAAAPSGQKANRICPKCKKVYYGVTYTECPNCHVPMPLYSVEAKIKAEEEERRLSSMSSATSVADDRVIKKFGLTGIDPTDAASARWVASELFANGFLETLSLFSSKTDLNDLVMMKCLRALVEQNWIIIRQLDRLNRSLETLNKEVKNDADI